jgi:hypothetical protein
MQISLLLKLLNDFTVVVEEIGNVELAEQLRDLQRLFSGQESLTVAKFLGALHKRRPSVGNGPESQAIGRVRLVLQGLQRILSTASKSAENDIGLIVDFIEQSPQTTITQLVLDAKGWTEPPKVRRANSARGKVTPVDVIGRYLSELSASENDNRHFDDAISKLEKDRLVSAQAMREIASQFTGIALAKKRTKKEALQAIADHQAISARQAARAPYQM